MLDSLDELRSFERSVTLGSLSAAARELGTTAAVVNSRIASLESRAGTPLINRTARKLIPTKKGLALLRQIEGQLKALAEAETQIAHVMGAWTGRGRKAANTTEPGLAVPAQTLAKDGTRSMMRATAKARKSTKAEPRRQRGRTKRAGAKAEQSAETLERLLDGAEYLFAKCGLHGVTLREICREAGIDTSLIYYYFDDKLALFKAVFARRADITIARRMKALDEYERQAGEMPTVDGALHVFLDTIFDLYIEGGEGWRNYATFCAQIVNTPEGAELFDEYFDPLVLRLINLLQKALPHVPRTQIFWGYDFVTGSLMHALARSRRIDRLSGGLCKSEDFAAVKAHMADFMASGFAAFEKK
ncbi:MAG: LysR family transcriptional regulator [Alphaproteobacteria bacterium]|nr:LysR family transcriptional regulator [Alphaproteobacteria bacterium]